MTTLAMAQNECPKRAHMRQHIDRMKMDASRDNAPMLVTIHDQNGARDILADPNTISVDEDCIITLADAQEHQRIDPFSDDAPIILPSFMPAGKSLSYMLEARKAVLNFRTKQRFIEILDGGETIYTHPDMVMVISSGIYPADCVGIEWKDVIHLTASSHELRISTVDRTLTLRSK